MYDNDKGKSTLIDFGLAAYGGKHLLYRGEQEIGTPLYAPPEIVATMHLPHHFYNHKTDIYSLGILFALLNAKRSPDEI